MKARTKVLLSVVFITALAGTFTITQFTTAGDIESSKKQKTEFTDTFFLEDCDFSTTGANRFFVLQPNYKFNELTKYNLSLVFSSLLPAK